MYQTSFAICVVIRYILVKSKKVCAYVEKYVMHISYILGVAIVSFFQLF